MRVSEIYASVQGEGPRVGQTTVFVRFGGCNLRCPGWPCDTQHAIDPAYRNEWQELGWLELWQAVQKIVDSSGASMITLTGGEPFLQPYKELQPFIERASDYVTIEAFTNGTIPYPDWLIEHVLMIVDWKLPGSGEKQFGPYNQVRIQNLHRLTATWPAMHAVKFVCKDIGDFDEAAQLYKRYKDELPDLLWYYGRVWDGVITNAKLVEHVMRRQLPWRLNVQLHNYVWPAHERGR